MINFEGAFGTPGIYSGVETLENQFWWDKWDRQIWFPGILGGAARDAGNGTTTILRPGLLLGRKTSDGKLYEWNPTGTDGTQWIMGVLGWSLPMTRLSSNQDRHFMFMAGGTLKADRVLVPGQASFGLSGQTTEFLVRMQMHPRFLFSDLLYGNICGGFRNIVAVTDTTYTITEAENNTLFTNRGAGGNIVWTLPATPKKGLHYGIQAVAAGTVKVSSGTSDQLIAFNNATCDTVEYSTSGEIIGGGFDIFGDGTGWIVRPFCWGQGLTAQTITITDT